MERTSKSGALAATLASLHFQSGEIARVRATSAFRNRFSCRSRRGLRRHPGTTHPGFESGPLKPTPITMRFTPGEAVQPSRETLMAPSAASYLHFCLEAFSRQNRRACSNHLSPFPQKKGREKRGLSQMFGLLAATACYKRRCSSASCHQTLSR